MSEEIKVINQEYIKPDEIIFDVDKYDRDIWELYNNLIYVLAGKKYTLELWYADGMRSPHLYCYISELNFIAPDIREEYKKKFLLKYCPYADLNLCEEGRLISAKNKIHFKHGTIKRLLQEHNK